MERLPGYIESAAQRFSDMYCATETELMSHIADLINKNMDITAGVDWDLQMMAEMGALREDNIKIITENLKGSDTVLNEAIEAAAQKAIDTVQPLYDRAVSLNLISEAPAAYMSAGYKTVINSYYNQAKNVFNLTNSTILESAEQAYRDIIDKTTEQMISGSLTRREALQKTVEAFAEKGLSALRDKAGREWSPEAYTNMVLRSTMNNTVRDVKFSRMDDYGVHVIKIPNHAGARPLCAPYQNGLYSKNNLSGYIEDIDGSKHKYEPLSSTSYGQAAGLLGINCGHMNVQECVPGLFIRRGTPLTEKELEQNAKEYDESKNQRRLEWGIRDTKRQIEILDRAGLDTQYAQAKLKDKQREMNGFIDKTGRTRRPDREQIIKKAVANPSKDDIIKLQKQVDRQQARAEKEDDRRLLLPKKLSLPDEKLKATVNVDFNNLQGVVPKGSDVTGVEIIAGYNVKRPLRDAPRLAAAYGGRPDEWEKKSGKVAADNYNYEVHWYERGGFIPDAEIKTKGVKAI